MEVKIVNHTQHPLPAYATMGASGLDLRAYTAAPIVMQPLQRALISTGIHIALPPGTEAQVRSRSGLALKHGITVLNSPGTIDSDYRGEVHVLLINLSDQPFTVHNGERIAQLIVSQYVSIRWVPVQVLDATTRGTRGYGSTGVT